MSETKPSPEMPVLECAPSTSSIPIYQEDQATYPNLNKTDMSETKPPPEIETVVQPGPSTSSLQIIQEVPVSPDDLDDLMDLVHSEIKKPIYSGDVTTLFGPKSNCPIGKVVSTDIGPYTWNVLWTLSTRSSETPKDAPPFLIVTVLKWSHYIFGWKFQMILEFQDSNHNPILKTFDINETHKNQDWTFFSSKDTFDVNETHKSQDWSFIASEDPDYSKIRFDYPVNVQWIATKTEYIWVPRATEVNLEDPNRVHDFVIVAGKTQRKAGHVIALGDEKTFYVHLKYLRAYSGYFQKLVAPTSAFYLNVDPNNLLVLLSMIHPNMGKLQNDKNVLSVLWLARKLEFWNVVQQIAEELCDTNNYPTVNLIHRLSVAGTLKHRKLLIKCMEQLLGMSQEEKCDLVRREQKTVKQLPPFAMSELLIIVTKRIMYIDERVVATEITSETPEYPRIVPANECDRVLHLDDESISVNSTVLSTWSRYFDELFSMKEVALFPELYIENVKPAIFRVILELIQTKNEQTLTASTVVPVLEAAHHLRMPSIIAICSTFIVRFGNLLTGLSIMDLISVGDRVNSGNIIITGLYLIVSMPNKVHFVKENLQHFSTLSETTRNNVFIAIGSTTPVVPIGINPKMLPNPYPTFNIGTRVFGEPN